MIPLLAVPSLNRGDLLAAMVASIDFPVERLLIVDNSPDTSMWDAIAAVVPACVVDTVVVEAPWNMGVAASWNLAIKVPAPYWVIANNDVSFAPGDLARLVSEMEQPGPRWVGMNGDWRVFGLNPEAVDAAGLFDENFHPIYCEDADYERRCSLAGVPWYFLQGGATHHSSAAIRSGYADDNARTYPQNVDYFESKWGGPVRQGRFTTPFDKGGSVRDWTLDLSRVRSLVWERHDDAAA